MSATVAGTRSSANGATATSTGSRVMDSRVNENIVALAVWAVGCLVAFGLYVAGTAVSLWIGW